MLFYIKLFWTQTHEFKTILCKLWGIVDVNLSFVILWVNWWVKKYIWQRITFDIKTQMNLVHLSFLGRLGRSGSSEKFCSFAKVSYCWGRFVCKIKFFVRCSVRTKKLINIEIDNFGFKKYTFGGQNMLNSYNQCSCQS